MLKRQQTLRMRQLQQTKLKMKSLLLAIPEFRVGAQHNLQMPRQVFFRKEICDARNAISLVRRNLQQGGVAACNLRYHGIPQKSHQLLGKVHRVLAFAEQAIGGLQDFVAGTPRNCLHDLFQNPRRCDSNQLPHLLGGQLTLTRGDCLIEQG